MVDINYFVQKAKENANNHGYFVVWDKVDNNKRILSIGDTIALCHSELSEALEDYRDDNFEHFKIEIADEFIRLFHLCGDLGIDIENSILEKMEKNKTRPLNHGRKNY